jgi:signal peptidase I
MSFDLYFLRQTSGKSWQDLMDALEQGELSVLDDSDRARWEVIKAQLTHVLPNAEHFDGEEACELSDGATGIQLLLAHGELSLSVPYWYDGPEAERLVPLLRRVVTTVEQITGLTAYDPQADARFVETGSRNVGEVFDQVHHALRGPDPSASEKTAEAGERPWWKRLFGR